MATIQKIKTIPGGKAIKAEINGVKNADVFDIVVVDGNDKFVFSPKEGKLSADGPSKSNFKIANKVVLDFVPNETTYFGILDKGIKRMTKKEVDAYQAEKTAAVLNSAADSAVKAEQVKTVNIKRVGFTVAGVIVLVSAIAGVFYFINKPKTA